LLKVFGIISTINIVRKNEICIFITELVLELNWFTLNDKS